MTTIAVCTLVLNVIVAVLLAVYGVWFNNVVKHQLGAKDATIETLKTEIDSLKGDRAPAIAAEYKLMREHADRMTEDKQKLDEQVRRLAANQTSAARLSRPVDPIDKTLAEGTGLILATNILMKNITDTEGVLLTPADKFIVGALTAVNQIESEIKSRNALARELLSKT